MKRMTLVAMSLAAILAACGKPARETSGVASHANRPAKKVLVVVSSENQLQLKNGTLYPTGYYLNELSVPSKRLMDAGYELVFANPKGNEPAMDQRSDNLKYFGGDQAKHDEIKAFHDSLTALKHPQTLRQVIAGGLSQYAAVFVPGGHAPMIDLMASPELGQILRAFHAAGKPTALICHGPIALAAAVADTKDFQQALIENNTDRAAQLASAWPYSGYQMTVFSAAEERLAEANLGGPVQFDVQTALEIAGGNVKVAAPWQSNVVTDRELITGQNPFSDEALANALLKALGVPSTGTDQAEAAPSKILVKCDGGEETQVVIKRLAAGTLRADVTVQSVGDSYPTYHYSVEESNQIGTEIFAGESFKLVVNTNGAINLAPSHLTVSNLGIDQTLKCQVQNTLPN